MSATAKAYYAENDSYDAADAFVWKRVKAGEGWRISGVKPGAPINPTEADFVEAGRRVAEGIFAAMCAGVGAVAAIEGPGIGSFERAQAYAGAVHAAYRADREATFAKCLAALDASLARIAAADDITGYLQAAE